MNMWEENKKTHLILGSLILSNLICTFLISTSSNEGNNMFRQSIMYFKHTFDKRFRKSSVHLYYPVFICWEKHQIFVFSVLQLFFTCQQDTIHEQELSRTKNGYDCLRYFFTFTRTTVGVHWGDIHYQLISQSPLFLASRFLLFSNRQL